MKEQWKAIPGYEGVYEISTLGNVRSLDRKNSRGANLKGQPKKQTTARSGYKLVGLRKEGRCSIRSIHQLVAIAFLDHTPCGLKLVVDHKDNNKLNNNVNNLQLITNRENSNKKHIPSSSQYVGVSWNKRSRKWHANIYYNKKLKHLGYFKDELEAHNAYQTALTELKSNTNI